MARTKDCRHIYSANWLAVTHDHKKAMLMVHITTINEKNIYLQKVSFILGAAEIT